MAETLGGKKKPPRQKPKADAPTADNVVQLDNTPPDERLRATLLNGVADLRALDEKIETAMSKVKSLRSDRKAVVGRLGAAGLPASLVKEAMDDADNTRTDIAEKEKARSFIRGAFALPTADWAASFEGMPTGAVEEVDWEARGYTDGVMARDRQPPSECPPERQQNWLKGYDAVMEARALKMAPKPKATPAPKAEEPPLILNESHFVADTALEDASTQTLVDQAAMDNVASHDRVIVRFGDKERVLKEPGYLDNGTDDAGVSEITDVPAEQVDEPVFH
jgi:hypothetical protein